MLPYQMEVRQTGPIFYVVAKLMDPEPGSYRYPGDIWQRDYKFTDEDKALRFAINIAGKIGVAWEPNPPLWTLIDAEFDRERLRP